MSTRRDESWGQLIYDPDLDEFEAYVRDDVSSIQLDRPVSAGCLVTGRCNLKCQYCYGNDESLPTAELSISEWAELFGRVSSWGLMRVDLSGGEPTIRNDINEIAQAALDAGLNAVLSTNGLLLARNDSLFPPLPVRLHISMDSGFAEIHEASRIRRDMRPSTGSMEETMEVATKAVDAGYRVRVLTCIGSHNYRGLIELGECLALAGINEWNISRVLAAGRAKRGDRQRWAVDDDAVLAEIHSIRECYPWMRIRYSNRTTQDGYFLLVLPDGALATQYTDHRDKVVLGSMKSMTLEALRSHRDFNLGLHARKWVAATTEFVDDPPAVLD